MCLLTFFPEHVLPDTMALWHGAVANDDGHGWAIVHSGRIIIGKSMRAEIAIEEFEKARAQFPKGPALFHSRWATHGTVNADNVHPFFVDGDQRTVLAHNGVLPIVPGKGDKRSDTRILADGLSKRFGSLRNFATRQAIIRWMGAGNKLVILTVNPRLRGNAFILNEDRGNWDGDIWYSNYGYVPYKPATKPSHETYSWPKVIGSTAAAALPMPRDPWDYEDVKCVGCSRILDDEESSFGFCERCDVCQDCCQVIAHCQCYFTPNTIPRKR